MGYRVHGIGYGLEYEIYGMGHGIGYGIYGMDYHSVWGRRNERWSLWNVIEYMELWNRLWDLWTGLWST